MPRLPTIVDDQQIIAQAGLLSDQPAGISEDDPGSILIVLEKNQGGPAKLGGFSASRKLSAAHRASGWWLVSLERVLLHALSTNNLAFNTNTIFTNKQLMLAEN